MIKTFNKLGTEGNFLNLIKDIYGKVKLISSLWWKTRCFPPRILNKTGMSTLTTSIQNITKGSSQGSQAINQQQQQQIIDR